MALTEEQRAVIVRDRVDESDLEAAFPAKLGSDDWEELTRLVFQQLRLSQPRGAVEMGWCWMKDGAFFRARWRSTVKPPAEAIHTVLIHRGEAWRPDSALRTLAHRQFGFPLCKTRASPASIEDLRQELVEELDKWLAFACYFYEGVRGSVPLDTKEEIEKALEMVIAAAPKYPRRSDLAGRLLRKCASLKELLGQPLTEPHDIFFAVEHAMEAGKLFAWLDVLQDEVALRDHRKATAFQPGRPGLESRSLEEAMERFHKKTGHVPTPREILKQGSYDTRKKQGKVIQVLMPAEGDDTHEEWITWEAFQKRVQSIKRRLFPGDRSRGRPRRATES